MIDYTDDRWGKLTIEQWLFMLISQLARNENRIGVVPDALDEHEEVCFI